jgi:hypothetical protein
MTFLVLDFPTIAISTQRDKPEYSPQKVPQWPLFWEDRFQFTAIETFFGIG